MKRVLIVDDSKFARMILKKMLEETEEYQVVAEAETDFEAVEKYKEVKPDIVTMDIIMPVESGLNALKQIISFDPEAKIIMVSAMGQEKIVEEALQIGAKGFVVKPVTKENLYKVLKEVVK